MISIRAQSAHHNFQFYIFHFQLRNDSCAYKRLFTLQNEHYLQPKKEFTMSKIFDSENIVWRFFGTLFDLVGLTLCWVLCSLPVLTLPAATMALYDSVARCIKGVEGGAYGRFFRTLRNELLRSIGLTFFWALIALVLGFGYYTIYRQHPGSPVALAYLVSLLIPVAVLLWTLLINSRFSYGFWALHKTAVFYTFAHLPQTLLVLALTIVAVEASLMFPFAIACAPAVLMYALAFFVEKVFQKYMPENP
jgi:uncharacterized membrane protein YesL